MRHIEDIFPMNKGQNGVVVVGKINQDAEPVYDELNVALHEFFNTERANRIYTWDLFDTNSTRFNGRVFSVNEENLVGSVGVIQMPKREIVQYEKGWDFAHEPFRGERHSFLGYFNNIMGGGPSGHLNHRNRDDFVRFAKRQSSGIERIMNIGPQRYYSSPEL